MYVRRTGLGQYCPLWTRSCRCWRLLSSACSYSVHRHPIDPGTGCASLPPERPFERGDVDVMQQCREPCLARASGRLIHTPEVRQQGLPALCPALRLFRRDPFLPLPFLHHLVSFGDFIDTMERSDSHPRCGVLWLSLVRRPRR